MSINKPLAYDLFCKAGGATKGLQRAGFYVVGVDIEPQPHYCGDKFIQADALNFPIDDADYVWCSPICKKYSIMTKRWEGRAEKHPDQITPMRSRLMKFMHLAWTIENVPGAPLLNPVTLCGSMFGLKVRRHRNFESNFPLGLIPPCDHSYPVVGVYGHAGGTSKRDGLKFGGTDTWREAMGIDWMTGNELAQAIPPAYAEFVGRAAMIAIGK